MRELQQMDHKTKLTTMHRTIHPRNNVDSLYVSRKEEGRGVDSIQINVDASIQRLEDEIKKGIGGLITTTRNYTENTSINRTK